jgi:hypothetical protein
VVASLIQIQGLGDLHRICIVARRDGIDHSLACQPDRVEIRMRLAPPGRCTARGVVR